MDLVPTICIIHSCFLCPSIHCHSIRILATSYFFILSLNKYFLRLHDMPSTLQSTRDIRNQPDRSCSHNYFYLSASQSHLSYLKCSKTLRGQKPKPSLEEKARQISIHLKGEKVQPMKSYCAIGLLLVEYEFICEIVQNDKN